MECVIAKGRSPEVNPCLADKIASGYRLAWKLSRRDASLTTYRNAL